MTQFVNLTDAINAFEESNAIETAGRFLTQQKLQEGHTFVRVFAPGPSIAPLYFFAGVRYWIAKKPYTSPKSFDRTRVCPIETALNQAKQHPDKGVQELASQIRKDQYFVIPLLLVDDLQWKNTEGGDIVSGFRVVDDRPKLFTCGRMLISSINDCFTDVMNQPGTPLGIFDPVKGYVLRITKKKVGRVEYSATALRGSVPIPEKFLQDIPDPVAVEREQLKSDEELTSIVRSFLFGNVQQNTSATYQQPSPIQQQTNFNQAFGNPVETQQPNPGQQNFAGQNPNQIPVTGSQPAPGSQATPEETADSFLNDLQNFE